MTAAPEIAAHQTTYQITAPVDRPPQRVVSLVPGLTESFFDLHLDTRLIGVSTACRYPEDGVTRLRKVGSPQQPDLEQISQLQPDLVLMHQDENRAQDAEQLAATGLTVWITQAQTVLDSINVLWEIMNVFDEPSMSERVRWIERQYDWTAAAAETARALRIFVPLWTDPWVTVGAKTYTHDLLRVCGAENIFAEALTDSQSAAPAADIPLPADETRYPRPTTEQIIAAQPEVILLPDAPFFFTEAHVEELSALDIPAAHNGHIYLVDGTLLTWQGTRLARALHEIPPVLAAITANEDQQEG